MRIRGSKTYLTSEQLTCSVKRHPDADSLYVEQIDIGEAEPRTVCSGLVKYMKEEDILGATVIVIVSHIPYRSLHMLVC